MIPDKLALNRLSDLADQANRHDYPTHTVFLTPIEQGEAAAFLSARKLSFVFAGGYESAERKICFLLPLGWSEDQVVPESAIMALRITPAALRGSGGQISAVGKSLTHRDYLGSLLGVGIRRDQVGDILLDESGATTLLMLNVVPLVKRELTQVGTQTVNLSEIALDGLAIPERERSIVKITADSLRFDKIAAAGFQVSRNDMADWIRAGQVQLNWRPEQRPDHLLNIGDVISLRGYGRIRLKEEQGKSKKDRHILVLEKY